MYLRPCRTCPAHEADKCDKTHALNSQLHRLGATSALIKCKRWLSLFPVGRTVTTTLPFETGDSREPYQHWLIRAVVIGHKQGKVQLWPLDDTEHIMIRVFAFYLTLTDDPPVEVCDECQKPLTVKRKGWRCDTCGIKWAEVALEPLTLDAPQVSF